MLKTLRELLGKPPLFHWVPFWGKDGAPSPTGYISTDPNVIGDQLSAMQAFGGEGAGVIALTYGPTVSPFIHSACMEMSAQCAERNMPFALCLDPWVTAMTPTGNKTSNLNIASMAVAQALSRPDFQTMFKRRAYLQVSGWPLVLDFNTGAPGGVYGRAKPYFLNRDFAWPNFDANSKPVPLNNNVALPCAFWQFNDGTGPDRNKSVWDQTKPARIWPENAGATWEMCVKGIPPEAQYVQIPTWNDYNEGTAIEPLASMVTGIKIGR